jgi:hypothetical protein
MIMENGQYDLFPADDGIVDFLLPEAAVVTLCL